MIYDKTIDYPEIPKGPMNYYIVYKVMMVIIIIYQILYKYNTSMYIYRLKSFKFIHFNLQMIFTPQGLICFF